LTAGEWFQLDNHPAHEGDMPEERQFVVLGLELEARNNLPVKLQQALSPDALASNSQPYRNRFRAVRRGVHLVPGYDSLVQANPDTLLAGISARHAKPTALGQQTAIVVGPPGEVVYTDHLGRVAVQFHWQRPQEHPEGTANYDEKSSTWLRIGWQSAGNGFGHLYLPRVGDEVVISFLNSDPDRPYISSVLYNGNRGVPSFSDAGALPANKALSGVKTQEFSGQKFGELLFDDSTGQVRTKLSSEHSKAQLNLGYLTHPRRDGQAEARGEGAELRTDASIAIRAAQGLLLTTYAKLQASGNQLARDEMIQLLDQCQELFKSLGDYAASHQALPLDPAPQKELAQAFKDWENGSNTKPGGDGGKPLIGAVAPDGLGFVTPKSMVSYSGLNHYTTAQKHLQFTAGENFSLNAGQGIALFATSKDLRLIAHQGQLLLQAQQNDIVANADKHMLLTANQGLVGMAKTIKLVAEDGSFIEIGNGITLGTSGEVKVKAASKSMSGPATEGVNLPKFSSGKPDQRFVLHYPNSDPKTPRPASNHEYEITMKDGSVLKGKSDAEGKTQLLEHQLMQVAHINILKPKL